MSLSAAEIWKDIPWAPGYQVSNTGKLKSPCGVVSKSKRTSEGYLRPGVTIDGECKKFMLHRLVAEQFIPNPENLPLVDHRNGIRHDNTIPNLKWCTALENSRNKTVSNYGKKGRKIVQLKEDGEVVKIWDKIKDAATELKISSGNLSTYAKKGTGKLGGFTWQYYENVIPGEIWKDSSILENCEVSNMGRIRGANGYPTRGSTEISYMSYMSYMSFRGHFVHRLIAEEFIENDDDTKIEVNHKDSNKKNNTASNLEWCTASENVQHSYDSGKRESSTYGRKIGSFDDSGICIAVYSSTKKAAENHKTTNAYFHTLLSRNDFKCFGYKWKYLDVE